MRHQIFDGQSNEPPGGALGARSGATPDARQAQIRRRRTVAGASALLLVLLLIAVSSGGGSSSRPKSDPAQAAAQIHGRGLAGIVPPPPDVPFGGITAQEDAAINRVMSYTPTVVQGGSQRREVALTFDDGPSTYTPEILSVLEREHVPATFFQIGQQSRMYPDLGTTELREGFPVENHTRTHPFLARLSPQEQQGEITDASAAIVSFGGPPPRLFRPPYGSYDSATLRILREQRMLNILWTVDTRDFAQPGVDRIVMTALSGAVPGAIILMHDGGGPRTQEPLALPRIIRGLRERHFRLVTVPQMMLEDPPGAGQAVPRGLSGVG
ncbi:MAG: polysaccharide deacetylase family protein [Actinobacteria bacterium]|nr:MAG: polysaccharide deacetylase family protein [Actinomycetota bacterium]